MDALRLADHIKLCRKNLQSKRVKCCATCPFEEEITSQYPEMAALFSAKRRSLNA